MFYGKPDEKQSLNLPPENLAEPLRTSAARLRQAIRRNRTKPRISPITRIRLITLIRVISEIRGSSEIPRPEARPAERKTKPNKLLRASDRFSRGLRRDMALRFIFHSKNLSHNAAGIQPDSVPPSTRISQFFWQWVK